MLAAMRQSFAEAQEAAPCIFLIDELDSVGDRARFPDRHRDYSTQVVNGLLELLDGAKGRAGVFVLGATNDASWIDPAVLRAGRLDRVVRIGLPTAEELTAMTRTHLGADLPGALPTEIGAALRGGTAADVAAAVRRARSTARRAGRDVTIQDLLAAARDGRSLPTGALRRRIAIHEAGHTIAAEVLQIGAPGPMSIEPHGGTSVTHLHGERQMTADELTGHIVHMLAGRAAEEVVLGHPSAGAGGGESSDLATATRLALALHSVLGLGTGGLVWWGLPAVEENIGSLLASLHAPVRETLDHAYAQAITILSEERTRLDVLAKALCDAGYLDAETVASLLAG